MKITAKNTIIRWDAERGQMAIINPGETADVSALIAQEEVEAGNAMPAGEILDVPTPAGEPVDADLDEPAPAKRTGGRRRQAVADDSEDAPAA